jgi:hypothetical protein
MRELHALKTAAIHWMQAAKPLPLRILLSTGNATAGKLFTHYGLFGFRGLHKFVMAERSKRPATIPTAYAKLDEEFFGGKLFCEFHSEHLTSTSAIGELSGQRSKFFLGLIQNATSKEIRTIPYIFADVVENQALGQMYGPGTWMRDLEIHIDQIESFSRVTEMKMARKKMSLDHLRGISERDIKIAIADILDEPNVPNDWGGERSDLFSSLMIVGGRRVSSAFLLKGPAHFRPMTFGDLGRNGDQIERLFNEPAELLVLQHCHEVTTPVRTMMRAFAQQMGNPRRFVIIDGYDTIRLLTAYKKCGFGSDTLARPRG